MSSQFSLLTTRRFLPFFTTQFLGAFNDNVFKQGLIILLTFRVVEISTLPVEMRAPLCQGLFILPFFLFSATAGQIADAWDKAVLIRLVKTLEVGIMALACAGFLLNNLAFLVSALFLLGIHSTLFGPIKYSILPQTLRAEELVGGNALVETGTSLAILIGSILGGYLITLPGDTGVLSLSFTIVGVAVAGLAASFFIPRTGVAAPDLKVNWNPVTETIRNLSFIRGNRTIFLSVLGISWFWFYGVTMLSSIPALTRDVLGGNEMAVIFLMATMSVGTGIGSLLCEKLSGKKVEIGLVPFGALGLTGFGVDIWFATQHHAMGLPPATTLGAFLAIPGNTRVMLDFLGLGVFSGFYIVPLYALVQARSEPSHRSRVIAGNNILNALFMVVASLMAVVLLKVGVSLPGLLAITALLSALVSIYIFTLVPEFLMRFLVWMFMSLFYRVERKHLERIPEEGACVLVCNHVSFFDALILATAIRRPPRFVMDHNIFKNPVLNFIFRTARAIPIASAKVDPALLDKAYDDIAAALEAGEMVCIFPEGRITDNGEMYPFKNGIQRIVERTPVPVIPMALQGMWGSFSSRKGGAAFTRLPRRFRSRVAVHVGQAVEPLAATPARLEREVRELRGDWQ
ncbi:MAG: putative acyltransferase family protein [Moraxellaceae bacterium]|jgi:1-acyl-sn-glycerol-3-phosphate acyltransferase|nr:putative acyltransferase family protein [Moraxellaceae bacterium]